MKFLIEEIVNATDAEVLKSTRALNKFSVATDSRTISEGQIYLPLKGEKFDGLDFAQDALNNGASGYFTNDKSVILNKADFIFYVEDAKEAYLKLANYYKRKVAPITIAITGSSGKTTTKEMLYSVLADKFKTHKSEKNFNNEIGLCQTLLSMHCETEVLIVEMGMRGLKDIELLSKYSEPDIAIITNVGTAHVGRLGTEKNIAKAKCEITKYLHKEGFLIAHEDELIKCENKYEGKTIYFNMNSRLLSIDEKTSEYSKFTYKNAKYKLNIEGDYNIQNALAVVETAILLGANSNIIASGLKKYRPIEKRWETQKISGFNIINDSYNSNPESLKAALKTFLELYESPKILVLGDMAELGKNERKYHKEILKFLKDYEYDFLITVGKLAKCMQSDDKNKCKNFKENDKVIKFIAKNMKKGSNILFKASRSMQFEEIIEGLKKI